MKHYIFFEHGERTCFDYKSTFRVGISGCIPLATSRCSSFTDSLSTFFLCVRTRYIEIPVFLRPDYPHNCASDEVLFQQHEVRNRRFRPLRSSIRRTSTTSDWQHPNFHQRPWRYRSYTCRELRQPRSPIPGERRHLCERWCCAGTKLRPAVQCLRERCKWRRCKPERGSMLDSTR